MEFEEHERPNVSCLEPHRPDIVAMRERSWPYRRIAEWLQTGRDLKISHEAVRKFCLVRGIEKRKSISHRGMPKPETTRRQTIKAPAESSPAKVFHYEGSGPSRTRKDRK